MSNLVKYNAARLALAEAHQVDEVKDIRDKAEAMAAYARQAKDKEMIVWVTEIKVRAERRAGQLLAEMPKAKGAMGNPGGQGAKIVQSQDATAQTLSDLGISKSDSSRWQKLAGVSDEKFEHAVAAAKEVAGEVTTAAMLRTTQPAKPQVVEPETEAPPDYTELDAARDQITELQSELVVARMGDIPQEQKTQAYEHIAELIADLKTANETIRALTISRDTYMTENAQMKRQMKAQREEIARLKSNK